MSATRSIIIEREKRFAGSAVDYVVFIDKEAICRLSNGEQKKIPLDYNSHNIVIGWNVNRWVYTPNIVIPADDLNYSFFVRLEFLASRVIIEEDQQQKEINAEIRRKRAVYAKIKSQIDNVFNQIIHNIPMGKRDFSPVENLSLECRESVYYKELIKQIKEGYFRDVVKRFLEPGCDPMMAIFTLRDLVGIPELTEEMTFITRHLVYFSRGSIISVLPPSSTPDAIINLKEKAGNLKEELFVEDLAFKCDPDKDSFDKIEQYVRLITRCDFEIEDLENLKWEL